MTSVTDRRGFLAGAVTLVAALQPAAAQSPGRLPLVGLLAPRGRSEGKIYRDAFLQGLRDLGWVENENVSIAYRFADGRLDRLPDLAAELIGLKVDVILASTAACAVDGLSCSRSLEPEPACPRARHAGLGGPAGQRTRPRTTDPP